MTTTQLQQTRKGPLRRWVTRLAVAVLCVFALHAIAINVFLSTSLWERAAGGDTDTIFISFERGWSIWPGTAHARNLTIRSSDSNVQFLLRIEKCDFSFSPYDLIAHKSFHVTQVNGKGVSFHAKQRVPSPSATPEYVDALPEIPGFATIPLRKIGEPDILARWDDRYWHLFTVQLENVVAEDVHDVWIDAMHWQGHATVTGGFYLKPIREVHLDDIRATVDSGQITMTKRVIADAMKGSFAVNMPPFDPRVASDLQIYRAVHLETDFTGRTPDLGNLPRGMFAPAKLSGPVEWRRLKFEMKDGRVADGTHIDAAVPGFRFQTGEQEVGADLSLVADVASGLTFRAAATYAFGTRSGKTLATSASAEIVGDAHALDTQRFLEDLHVVATVPDAIVPDFRAIAPMLEGGHAEAHGQLELWWKERRARGQGALAAHDFNARLGEHHAHGDVAVEGSFASWYWEQEALEDVKATVRVGQGRVSSLFDVKELVGVVEASEIDLADEQVRGVFRVDAAHVGAETKGYPLAAALHAEGVIPDCRWGRGEVSIQSATIALTNASIGDGVTIAKLTVDGKTPRLRFSDPFDAFGVKASLAGGVIRDPAALNAFLPEDAALHPDAHDGRLAFEAEGVVEHHVGRGKVSLHGTRIGVRGTKVSVLGDLALALEVSDVNLDEGTMRVHPSNAAFTDVAVKMGETERAATAKRLELAATANRVEMKHPTLSGVDYHLIVSGALMPDVRPLGDLLTSDPLAFGIDGGAAQMDVDLTSKSSDKTAGGHALVVLESAHAHLKETQIAGNAQVALQVKGYDPELDAVNIGGSTIALRDINTGGASAKATHWDADLQLVGGALRVTKTPVFDGFVQLRADDSTPILALVLQNSLPKFLVGLAKADALTGQARMTVEPGRVALLGAHIAGGDLELRGNYVTADHHVRGAITVAKGPLSAGVKVDDDGTQVRLFGLDTWMKQETSAALSLYRDPKESAKGATHSAP